MVNAPFIELQQVDSTNNYATERIHAGMAQHGLAVFAHRQTAGKGQRRKTWITGTGQNIALSVVIEPRGLVLSQSFLLSMAVALGTYRFLNQYAGDTTKIKWPNDVYWRDRKAAGILIENVLQGTTWKYTVAGIGVNINQTDFGDLETKAVSLKQITGKAFNTTHLAKELHADVLHHFEALLNSPQKIMADYHASLYKRDEPLKWKKDGRVFEAILKGVTPQGHVVVQHAVEEQFAVGEIEWVL